MGMPIIQADRLTKIGEVLFEKAGASAEEAATVTRHCVSANLTGHDSHGIIQVPTYIDRIDRGHIIPGAPFEIDQESATTTVINGNWGFGYVVNERAMNLTIEKAKTSNVAAATVYHQSHVGRAGSYPLMAAKEGMIAMMTADSGRSPKAVAPFGGRVPRLGTNPIAIAMPSNLEGPFFIDMATSAAAAGKVKLAQARGQSIPDDWVVDKDGRATTDPAALSDGGAIQPLGGAQGFKGYGLAAMVEIFSGLLTGLGFGVEPTGKHNDGVFMAVFNVAAFRPLEQFKQEVTEFAEYLKATPTAEGFEEVLYPGEIEHQRMLKRSVEGIDVEDATWDKLAALAEKYGVSEIME
jgi:LDH2 family malate/lactate/ureidoglycolate dehydrogenase